MPYGPRVYGKASRVTKFVTGTKFRRGKAVSAARSATVKRKTNRAVARIQRKAYVPQKRKNTASIVTLARQVKSLQNAQVGLLQMKRDGFDMQTVAIGNTNKNWSSFYPMVFCMNDIIQQVPPNCPIYHLQQQNETTSSTAEPMITWVPITPASTQAQYIPTNFWSDYQNDNVSLTAYALQKMKITLDFKTTIAPGGDDIWVRLDFLSARMKNQLNYSVDHQYTLPNSVSGLSYLAQVNRSHRNQVNYAYFKRVMKTRWLKFSNTTDQTRNVHRSITFYVPCNGKMMTPDLSDWSSSGEDFYGNTPIWAKQWCVINQSAYANFHVTGLREYTWRDPSGTTPALP